MMPNDAGKNEGGERLIHIATIIAAHGIKGEVKIQSFCEEPTALADYGPLQDEAGATYAIRVRAATGPVLVASLKGVADRSAAERLAKVKTRLFIPRSVLGEAEEGRHFLEDFKGLTALDEKGDVIAFVRDVANYGAGDILVLEKAGEGAKGEFMLPLKPPFVDDVNMKAGTVRIMVPEGWLDTKKK